LIKGRFVLKELLIAFVTLPQICRPQLLVGQWSAAGNPVFRPPFVLKLRVDNEHYYEEKFKPIPFGGRGRVPFFWRGVRSEFSKRREIR
jgi:hypothetical protein